MSNDSTSERCGLVEHRFPSGHADSRCYCGAFASRDIKHHPGYPPHQQRPEGRYVAPGMQETCPECGVTYTVRQAGRSRLRYTTCGDVRVCSAGCVMLNERRRRDSMEADVGSASPPARACDCNGVAFGTYANAVALYPPPCLGITRWPVTVDRCIALEVIDLWNMGIRTTGNCCGHNQQPGYIGVDDRHVQQMLDMGYKAHPGHPSEFYPRSLPSLTPSTSAAA